MKNMKLIHLLFVLLSIPTSGQQVQSEVCTKHLAISAKMNFEEDLKNNTITLYVRGGIVSAITLNDKRFEKLYNVKYRDFGCVVPEDVSFYEKYNQYVFHYLEEKYGNDWKKLANKNAFGWNKLGL